MEMFINTTGFLSRMEDLTLERKFQATILGAAIGDALGMPTEYISKQQLDYLYGGKVTKFEKPSSTHPCSHLEAGQYTDDTQQLIILAESLIEKKRFDVDDLGKRLGEWAHKCVTILGYDRFSGSTSISAGLKLYQGGDPFSAGMPRFTCGSAMRIAPVGLFYHQNIPQLKEAATWVSAVTHNHPVAIDSALLISHIIAYFLKGFSPKESVWKARQILTSDLTRNIDLIIERESESPRDIAAIVGASESSYETVPMALHCFLHSPGNFEETVIEAANLVPGDTDSIACIAGALSGAYNGLSAIPSRFREGIEDGWYLLGLGKRLFEASEK